MTIHTSPDIVGAGVKVALSATDGLRARRIFLTAHSGNARFGDTNVGVAQGVELPADQEVTISASDGDITDAISLTQAFVYVPNGTTVTMAWGI